MQRLWEVASGAPVAYREPVPSERNQDRAAAKRDAERTADYFARLLARGFSRKEACELTVAYVLGRVAQPESDEREEWQRE